MEALSAYLPGGACFAALLLYPFACSPDVGEGGKPLPVVETGGGAGRSADASLGSGSTGFLNEGGFVSLGEGAGGLRPPPANDACAALSQEPEEIIIYTDASYTDTLVDVLTDTFTDTFTDTLTDTSTILRPVALFVMVDRSGSMVTGIPAPASPESWNNSSVAVTSFVNDPRSQGLLVGLGTFPYGQGNTAACDGSDCGQAVVPIAALPGNAGAMIQAMQTQAPSNPVALTPTECGIRGMINQCLTYSSNTGLKCATILVTDGNPTQCDQDQQRLISIVAEGSSRGVLTYTIGLPGSNAAFLNALSQAGGTNASLDVSQGPQAFIDALNAIREKVTTTVSSTVSSSVSSTVSSTASSTVTTSTTTRTVISTPLDCQWKIPPPEDGKKFDPALVNMAATTRDGVKIEFGHVGSVGECAATGGGWYYDDPAAPTQVLVCPETCNTLKGLQGARVNLLFGCKTVIAIPK